MVRLSVAFPLGPQPNTSLRAGSTLYHAEYLYRLAAALSENAIVVPSELHAFYSSLLISPLSETSTSIPSDSPVHGAIVSGLRARADDFVRIVRQWKAPDGSLSEQFSR